MAYIRIRTEKLSSTVNTIDNNLRSIKNKMREANAQVSNMSSSSSSVDYSRFSSKWNEMNNSNAAYNKIINGLKSYSDYLKYAKSKYTTAQNNAIARANSLPR